ncbi:MAG TPA: flagellar M-ring protein FliF [Paenalcaligenes hominis]|uniref:Flagellar M-ring protein n=1 Tax=Paenalcaligenes hominis TaxID=643674 RepID=A0A9D3ABA1_9BURK|nr:flagellar basal-body MS-ring/collar protein FliF [Paenalcaligenes hominis]NJB65949.1 flagellar M-ring protein FliF [Paenalcaligenes hominis]GGE70956.1 flagellar M-ring protein [Paenalcaligenes hominis]HJH24290.1 flagellar M-ring protein FliF [Paenalcaligenes hominis]
MSQASSTINRVPGLDFLRNLPRTAQIAGAAGVVALVLVAALWSRAPDYNVLFSNLDDKDGGAIVTALGQMNVPYQFSDNGSAILIPKERVHEVRMQLASQGLPRGGNVGFELLDQARFGASQFTEQVTYQRALEGELASSISAVHAVQDARVHLAIPRETLFVRDRQAPTASVLLTLYSGRSLSESQVSAIQWLVSSSVPSLSADNVSVVDQDGRLLTAPSGQAGANSAQRDFTTDIEHRAVQRIMTLLNPLLGTGNVRAQVSADIDFSAREHTSEVYRPNQKPGEAAVRSEQSSVALNNTATNPEGVPGALTNQPPLNPVAPIVDENATAPDTAADTQAPATATTELDSRLSQLEAQAKLVSPSGNARTDITTNYEVDRTISHVKGAVGELKRLSIAVVINHRYVDKEYQALSDDELESIRSLVMQAVGYSAERGDSISVVNSRFSEPEDHSVPFWKNNTYIEAAMTLFKYLVIAILFFAFWRIVINPIIQGLIQARLQAQTMRLEAEENIERQKVAKERAAEINRYEDNMGTARLMAEKDPRAVAMVLRAWMNKEDNDDN